MFRQRSVFLTTLSTLGLEYRLEPASQHLSCAGVASIMENPFTRMNELAGTAEVTEILAQPPQWIVIKDASGGVHSLLKSMVPNNHLEIFGDKEIALMDLISDRKNAELIDIRATLYEAYKQLKDADIDAACVHDTVVPSVTSVIGILTRESIENYVGHGAR